jgi:hypothetical protein
MSEQHEHRSPRLKPSSFDSPGESIAEESDPADLDAVIGGTIGWLGGRLRPSRPPHSKAIDNSEDTDALEHRLG